MQNICLMCKKEFDNGDKYLSLRKSYKNKIIKWEKDSVYGG